MDGVAKYESREPDAPCWCFAPPKDDCGPTVVVGDASGTLPDFEKLKGEGMGEYVFSEASVVGEDVQPKKLPSREELGDLGSGLSVLGVLTSLLFFRTREGWSD